MDPFAKPAEVARPKFFQSSNGDLVEVTDALIEACYTVKCLINGRGRMVFKNSLGGVFIYENNQVIHQKEQKIMATLLQNDAERLIVFIHEVRTPILRRLLDFVAYHQQDATERERKAWNANFIEQCSQILCELASAAYYLDHKPLVNLTSKAIASQISGKSTEELREALGTQNEPPMPASMTNHLPARFRLQAKVDSRKQRQKLALQNGTALPAIEAPPPTVAAPDTRTVEEVLAFLGEDVAKSSGGGGAKKGKGKKSKGAKSPNAPTGTQPTSAANTHVKSNASAAEEKEEKDEHGGEAQDTESATIEAPAVVIIPEHDSDHAEEDVGMPLNATIEFKKERNGKAPLNLSASSSSSSRSYGSDHSASSAGSSSTTTSVQCPVCPGACNCESVLDTSFDSSVSPSAPPGSFFPHLQHGQAAAHGVHADALKLSASLLPALTFPSPFVNTMSSSSGSLSSSAASLSLSSSLGVPTTTNASSAQQPFSYASVAASSVQHQQQQSSSQQQLHTQHAQQAHHMPLQQTTGNVQLSGSLPPFTSSSSSLVPTATNTTAANPAPPANPFAMPPISLAAPPGFNLPTSTYYGLPSAPAPTMDQWDLPPGLAFPTPAVAPVAQPVVPPSAGFQPFSGFGAVAPTTTTTPSKQHQHPHQLSPVHLAHHQPGQLHSVPLSAIPSMWEPSSHAALAHLTKFEDDTDSLDFASLSLSGSQQYFLGGDEDAQDGVDVDAAFEEELAQFRQSLEIGIRDSQRGSSLRSSTSSNASASSGTLRLSSDHHSVSSGHRPVGAC